MDEALVVLRRSCYAKNTENLVWGGLRRKEKVLEEFRVGVARASYVGPVTGHASLTPANVKVRGRAANACLEEGLVPF